MSRQRTTTPRQWELLPQVDLGGSYEDASAEQRRWVGDLARLFARKPENVGIFVRVGFASVVIQALFGGREPVGESGHDLDARAIASVTVPGADCGDP